MGIVRQALDHRESREAAVFTLGLVALHLLPTLTGNILRVLCHTAKFDFALTSATSLALIGLGIDGHGAVCAHQFDLLKAQAPKMIERRRYRDSEESQWLG